MIARAAIQEVVDIIGVSSHASNYSQIEELVELLRRLDADDIPVVCGGNIPKVQAQRLKEIGVANVFPPGASSESIISFFLSCAKTSSSIAIGHSIQE
jgi:methylmalonyl-CoA mutase C-terminal domain/subunit